MSIVIHNNALTFHCIDDVICNVTSISDVWANKLKESQKALAATGILVSNGSNGYLHGRNSPFNGWMQGRNFNQFPQSSFATRDMIGMSNVYNRYVIQGEVKLGSKSARTMQWVDFRLSDPGTSGNSQLLAKILLTPTYTPNPANPWEAGTPVETAFRFRIDQPLNALITPIPGAFISLDFSTEITSFGTVSSKGFNINDDNYWAGVLNVKLWFYNKC